MHRRRSWTSLSSTTSPPPSDESLCEETVGSEMAGLRTLNENSLATLLMRALDSALITSAHPSSYNRRNAARLSGWRGALSIHICVS